MRKYLKPNSFKNWRARVSGRKLKHEKKIFKSQKDKRLIIRKIKANGSKDQDWESKPIDWSAHTAGKLLQGGNPVVDGMCSYAVVDLDRSKKTGSLFTDKNTDLELKKSGP